MSFQAPVAGINALFIFTWFFKIHEFLDFSMNSKIRIRFFLENVPNLERVTFSKRRRSVYSKHKESIFSFVPKKVYKFNKCRIQFKIEHIQYKTYIIYRLQILGYQHKILERTQLSRFGQRSRFLNDFFNPCPNFPRAGIRHSKGALILIYSTR